MKLIVQDIKELEKLVLDINDQLKILKQSKIGIIMQQQKNKQEKDSEYLKIYIMDKDQISKYKQNVQNDYIFLIIIKKEENIIK